MLAHREGVEILHIVNTINQYFGEVFALPSYFINTFQCH